MPGAPVHPRCPAPHRDCQNPDLSAARVAGRQRAPCRALGSGFHRSVSPKGQSRRGQRGRSSQAPRRCAAVTRSPDARKRRTNSRVPTSSRRARSTPRSALEARRSGPGRTRARGCRPRRRTRVARRAMRQKPGDPTPARGWATAGDRGGRPHGERTPAARPIHERDWPLSARTCAPRSPPRPHSPWPRRQAPASATSSAAST